jgi:molybdopterin synthase sulfur carrier subunit
MTITVSIPTNLLPLTGGLSKVTAAGSSVLEIIDDLDGRYPGIRARVVAKGKVHRFLNVYVNDEDIRFGDDLKTEVREGDCLTLLSAVAGG